MSVITVWRRAACAIAIGAIVAPAAAGQTSDDSVAYRSLATRATLEALARRLEERPDSIAAGASLLAHVRHRLTDGDFSPGDRVVLAVEGEPTLSDTFAVAADRELHLPGPVVGALPMGGVLRSELESHVTRHVSRFVRDPVVRASALVRLSIQGEVMRPGFYGVPPDAVLSDALMAAGGTTTEADMRRLRIERDGRTVWEGPPLQRVIADGRTIDETFLQAGDQITVARRPERNVTENLRLFSIILSVAGGLYGLSRAF
jgi:protein involved in polysaccharide export with SLBB domain